MFDEVAGLPLHPLAVHGAVVLVPLLVLAALAYVLVPRLRTRVGWVAVLLSVIAPISTVVAKLSGDEFQRRRGLPLTGQLGDHHDLGTITMWLTLALGVLTLGLVWLRSHGAGSAGSRWTARVLSALVVVAAAAAAVYVVRAGDLGSRIVWEEIWKAATG